jgi:hypothetical protein
MAVAADQIIAQQFSAPRAEGEGDHPSSRPDIGLTGYWKCQNGEIKFLDSGPNGMQAYTRKRMYLLPEYGNYSLSPKRGWDPMNDPFKPLLEQGGIKEFSLAQIVELNWHRRPHPVIKRQVDVLVQSGRSEREALDAAMPQLKGYEWEDHTCLNPTCRNRLPFNSEGELRQHEVLHREDVRTREQTKAISEAISGIGSASAETMAPALKAIAEVVQSLAAQQATDREERAQLQANFNALLAEIAKPKTSSK